MLVTADLFNLQQLSLIQLFEHYIFSFHYLFWLQPVWL